MRKRITQKLVQSAIKTDEPLSHPGRMRAGIYLNPMQYFFKEDKPNKQLCHSGRERAGIYLNTTQ
ncbi:hypothetical protein [Pseudoalteromonas rubra]|uniref:hypothetical protein n=1 Tax=Pseudoalteromonas rubra TaxID=43658 RepID=UPI00138E1CEB|nr:hypothetical protein [Pseudoalteromonas rubra]